MQQPINLDVLIDKNWTNEYAPSCGADKLLTAFIGHYENSGRRTWSFGIEHLQWHQVLRVRL